jgi:hypothetical protein
MDLVLFHDKIYGKIDKRLFLFESTWDTFRPITGVFWNGTRFVSPIQNPIIFSEHYGYDTLSDKEYCRRLIDETELSNARQISDPVQLWRWYGETRMVWWRDRLCVFENDCVARDNWKEYIQYLNSPARTIRNKITRKFPTLKRKL